jgi:hypothetical protein
MSRKGVVLMLAAVVAVAVAIPALADSGTSAKTASVRGLSTRALAKAKVALRISRGAKRTAHRAASSANSAQAAASSAQTSAAGALKAASSASEKAGGAQLKAEEAKATVASTVPHIGFTEGSVSTESLSFVELGGPSVTLTVPTSGLVQVWGQANIEGPGAVSLYEGGHPVEGQAIDCNGAKDVLFSAEPQIGETQLVGTPAAPSVTGACGSLGAPGPVLFQTTTGQHTFEFRYAACSCGGPPEKATFSERRLVVAPLP